jgi:hypothetical protein
MNSASSRLDAISQVRDEPPVPFATVYVTLTKQEHVRLVMEANYWKSQQRSAKQRSERNDRHHQYEMLRSKQEAVEREKAYWEKYCADCSQASLLQPVHEIGPLTLGIIAPGATSRLWNEYIARYHYLGYTPMSGSQMRYNVFAGEQLVALLSFGASAWKLAGREPFIGWQEHERLKNLQLVVNNARFLILPWIQSKGLASKILSRIVSQLPNDWHQRYGYRPVLFETFVESPRHRGTCYKAANWINVGQTTGRGKKSTVHHQIIPIKDIWLYPLHKNFASVLCR